MSFIAWVMRATSCALDAFDQAHRPEGFTLPKAKRAVSIVRQ